MTPWGTQPGHKIHGLRRPENLVLWQRVYYKDDLRGKAEYSV